jgi:energy-coupling factor transporter ATP-binding protein EcfA2
MFLIQNLVLPNKVRLNFSMQQNAFLHLIGKNGSGKSLLLTAIARLIACPYATFQYFGKDIQTLPMDDYRSQVMYLPSHTHNYIEQSTIEFFTAPMNFKVHSQKKMNLEILHLLESFTWWNKTFSKLSSGEKQLLSFYRILNLNPKVILIDEGFTNLDAEKIELVNQSLIDWQKKNQGSIILIDHHQDVARHLNTQDIYFQDLFSI